MQLVSQPSDIGSYNLMITQIKALLFARRGDKVVGIYQNVM